MVAQRHGVAPATVAFAWLMRLPSRPLPVTGSRRVDAIAQAVAAREIRLSAQDWTEVWQAATGHEVP